MTLLACIFRLIVRWRTAFSIAFNHRLIYPGHLSILDAPQALSLVTMSGITPVDYSYTHGYSAPSGRLTMEQRLAYPFRYALSHISPWLASKLVGE